MLDIQDIKDVVEIIENLNLITSVEIELHTMRNTETEKLKKLREKCGASGHNLKDGVCQECSNGIYVKGAE